METAVNIALLEDSESSNIESNYFKHQNRDWTYDGSICRSNIIRKYFK